MEVSSIVIPLKVEQWQDDVLQSRFRVYRDVYNAMLRDKLRIYRDMISSSEYNVPGVSIREIHRKYGFSEYGFNASVKKYKEFYKDIVLQDVSEYTIAKPMWMAFNGLLKGKANNLHFKRDTSMNALTSCWKSGIRVIDEFGVTCQRMDLGKQYFVRMGAHKGKILTLPICIPKKNLFLQEMMGRNIRLVRILRKKVRGRYKYFLVLCVEGKPAEKLDKNGNIKHRIKEGIVGLYIDTVSLTAANEKGESLNIEFGSDIDYDKFDEDIRRLSRMMEVSRRAINPNNYNSDGTIKTGSDETVEGTKLVWNNSHNYRKLCDRKADMERVMAEQRQINANIYA